MTVHAPAHPSGVVSPQTHHHYLAWLAVSTAVVLAIAALLLSPPGGIQFASPMSEQQRSLVELRAVEFRAAERLDGAAGEAVPEWKALVEFRAAERESR
jgi:hypothetical protein